LQSKMDYKTKEMRTRIFHWTYWNKLESTEYLKLNQYDKKEMGKRVMCYTPSDIFYSMITFSF
jgi:hypothetical protein